MGIKEHSNLLSSGLLLTSLCGSGGGIRKMENSLGWVSTAARKSAEKVDLPGFSVTDGRMPFPVNHGASSEDSLLQVIFGTHLRLRPTFLWPYCLKC